MISRGVHGFPWASTEPTRIQRTAVSASIATLAGVLAAYEYLRSPGHHSDFGIIWFGARAMLHGTNPWPLIGPGLAFDWNWPLLYPAPALILALPVSWLPEGAAATIFIWVSVFLLAWGATRDGWHRLPAFASLPFMVAASASQWSALMASSWFIPGVAIVWIAKPTLGVSLAVSASSRKTVAISAAGGFVLLVVSLILLPSWPESWLHALRSTGHMQLPITQWGGFAIAANLFRWRRPEARLLLALALVPQTPAVYDLLLILLIVPNTYHEALVLSLFCTAGLMLEKLTPAQAETTMISVRGMLVVASCYLPATALVLRRSNVGASPVWLTLLDQMARARTQHASTDAR